MKKFEIWTYICLLSAILFTVLNINFSLDVSLLAFPLALIITGFVVYFTYFKLFSTWKYKTACVVRKLLQYLPFVLLASFIFRRAGINATAYWFDVVSVIFWCINFISCQASLYFLHEKRILNLYPNWKNENIKKTKKNFLLEVIDWVDALVQAVCMVLLIQIFILQLYVIPSESMVPEFLIKDRVVVLKTTSGPKFPLSNAGVPCMKNYKRGDVVVFRNPHYTIDRKSEVQSVLSQIVFMLSFTTINLNVDENGQPKADPLVKRICGEPGEQLVMQDGVLYSRTSDSDIFKAVEKDAKFACWNLNALPKKILKNNQVKAFPLSQSNYERMLNVEEIRREFNIDNAIIECNSIKRQFYNLYKKLSTNESNTKLDIPLNVQYLFENNELITDLLLENSNGINWFNSFISDWINELQNYKADFNDDIYLEANFKLNLMIKLNFAKLVLRNMELILSNSNKNDRYNDLKVMEYLNKAEDLFFYTIILDQRNMPMFPSNVNGKPNYIPKDCYFMMGDNRFNSLDMRHSYEQKLQPLTHLDKYSVLYYSNMEPQYVHKKNILGSTLFKFWPLNRVGKINQ